MSRPSRLRAARVGEILRSSFPHKEKGASMKRSRLDLIGVAAALLFAVPAVARGEQSIEEMIKAKLQEKKQADKKEAEKKPGLLEKLEGAVHPARSCCMDRAAW